MAKPAFGMRRVLSFFIGLLLLGAIVYLAGPRPDRNTDVTFDPTTLPADIQSYVDQSEARFDDIRPGNQKQIVWAYPASRARTPLAIVYIHGFSASPGETRPLPDMVAEKLGANLYFTRLKGHGRSNDAMLEGSAKGWMNDLAEAIAIGRKLGEKVIIMGASTGATLITIAAARPDLMKDVIGLVQISPNYGVQAKGASLLSGPWAERLVRLILGERRAFKPDSDLHAKFWTYDYPSLAVVPMGVLIDLANEVDPGAVKIPSLFVYSPLDKVIQPELAKAMAQKWGAASKIIEVTDSTDPSNHVIAGDALSPNTTERLASQTADWISKL